jgi:hypothetical protein
MEPSSVGISWYRGEEDFLRLKAMFKDGDVLPDTYDSWLQEAKRVSGYLTLEGFKVVRVYLDPETFPAWCQANGYDTDAQARARYATEFAQKDVTAR